MEPGLSAAVSNGRITEMTREWDVL
jgi:hypothetical protein